MKKELFDYVKAQTEPYKVALKIYPGPIPISDDGAGFCNGYFSVDEDENPILAINFDLSDFDFAVILLHEFNHFRQWLENTVEWEEYEITENHKKHIVAPEEELDNGCGNVIDLWIRGLEIPPVVIYDIIQRNLRVEADCERRTVESIRNNPKLLAHLGNSAIETYIQKSNAYMYQYYFCLNERRYPPTTLYMDESFWKLMPKDEVTTDFYKLSEGIK